MGFLWHGPGVWAIAASGGLPAWSQAAHPELTYHVTSTENEAKMPSTEAQGLGEVGAEVVGSKWLGGSGSKGPALSSGSWLPWFPRSANESLLGAVKWSKREGETDAQK